MVCFRPYETQGGSFWLEGNFFYTGYVVIANVKVLTATSAHDFFSLLWVFGSIAVFFLCTLIDSLIPSSLLYGTLQMQVASREFWWGLTYISLAIICVDLGLDYLSNEY